MRKSLRKLLGLEDEPRYTINVHDNSPLLNDTHEHVLRGISKVMQYLAGLTEKHPVLHIRPVDEVLYPRDESDELHIVLGARPPGKTVNMWGSYAVGVQLHQDPHGERIFVGARAEGYGRLVKDDSGHCVAQVVGTTIYCFVPMSEERLYLLASNGTDLFRRVVVLAWDELILHYRVPDDPPLLDEVALLVRDQRARENLSEDQQKELRALDDTLARLSHEMQEAMFARRMLVRRMEEKDSWLFPSEQALSEAWQQLTEHSLFNSAEETADGHLHVRTKDVLVADGAGTARHLGRFVVRLVDLNSVTVWSEYLTHLRQIPHPHISIAGTVCFGNITTDINQLLIENQGLEAVRLIFDWLQDGYDAGLAENKLEEWPAVDGFDEASVLDLTRVFFQPQEIPEADRITNLKGDAHER